MKLKEMASTSYVNKFKDNVSTEPALRLINYTLSEASIRARYSMKMVCESIAIVLRKLQ